MGEPRALVVVGAAAGMGRWLVDHAFAASARWEEVVLVDRESTVAMLRGFRPPFTAHVTRAYVTGEPEAPMRDIATKEPVAVPGGDVAVCLAVPSEALTRVAGWLLPLTPRASPVLVVSPRLGPGLAALRDAAPDHPAIGAHPLFDASARALDGQTVLVVPREGTPEEAHAWFVADVDAAGGIASVVSAEEHDRAMTYVQTMAHQALLGLVDAVTTADVDLDALWAARTPVFETLFGLAIRILAEGRQATTAELQVALEGDRVADELAAAARRTRDIVATGDQAAVETRILELRDRFTGALFEAIQDTAGSAISAVQAKRAELARHGRVGGLVGVRPVGRRASLRVGRIVDVDATSVDLLEVMVGERGHAVLLEGTGRRNAKRVGQGGKPKRTTFGLAHIDLVTGDELDDELDDWLAHIRRDVRFLVPESVAGAGVLTVVANHAAVREAEVVSEVVRTGQRSVVIRVGIRADQDVDDMVELLRARVEAAYQWPAGLSRPADRETLAFLGPAGTFSEEAADHALRSVGRAGSADLVPCESFDDVLAAVTGGGLGILPVSSSASGLVTRAMEALLAHDQPVEAGGVVDVAVRFDAYVREDQNLADLRGAPVYSHPQGLAQCSGFIRRWDLQPVACPSTTEALRIVAAADEGLVAVAGADRGADLGLKVAEREVDDLSGSITRFVILGPPGSFGELAGGNDPTLRSLYVGPDLGAVVDRLRTGTAAFDELLSSPEGRFLWITSRPDVAEDGLRFLGRLPWTPRTPVVRVEVAPPPDP